MTTSVQPRVFLAGRIALETNGVVIDEARFPGRQGRLLFAYLVAEQGRAVPRDELAEALWAETPPTTWDKALTGIVSRLRGVLADGGLDGANALTGAFGCYRPELPAGTWIDVVVAADAVKAAEDAIAAGDLDRTKAAAVLADSLLRQPFLPGEDGAWVEEKRRGFADLRGRALDALTDAALRRGDGHEGAMWAEQAIALEPFRETGYRRLMEAHVASGNRAEALRVYERCRRLLADELGTYPSPETESLYRGLLEGSSGRVEAATMYKTQVAETSALAGLESAEPPGVAQGAPRRRRRRTRAALAGAALLVGGVVAAALALVSGAGSSPKVLPNSVVRIDADTLKVEQVVPVGDSPDLVVAAGGFVWVEHHVLREANSYSLRNAGDRTLTRVDPATGGSVVVGGGLAPCGLTADPSGDVWVADCYPADTGRRDNVVRVDARTLNFERTWQVTGGDGFYRGLAYGGGSLWVGPIFGGITYESFLTRVDPQTGARRTMLLTHGAPAGLQWSEGYGDLWMENFADGSLTRLHAATGARTTVLDAAFNPAYGVVDGDVVWVADWSAPQVTRLNAVGRARPRRISLPTGNPLGGVENIAGGAGAVWATMPQAGELWRIDPKTNAATRVRLPYLPTGVTTDANDVWVTVRKR
jgi:DNA-binding SARP family transcriptional activator/streptogramin lyase